MKRFAALYAELDGTTSTAAKVEAMRRYLAEADAADAAWAVYFLSGGRPRQLVRTSVLRALATEIAGLSDWLFEASYQAVGDLAETIAHVLPPGDQADDSPLSHWVESRMLPLKGLPEAEVRERVRQQWQQLDPLGRMLWVKLVGGGFRVGISRLLVQRALAAHAGVEAACIAQRMVGYTDARTAPTPRAYAALVTPEQGGPVRSPDDGRPYPFFLAHPLPPEASLDELLGTPLDWLAEWKYDGIRAQLVKRGGRVWLWSRGEELVTEAFPEVAQRAQALPEGTVLDGELLAWHGPPPVFAPRLDARTALALATAAATPASSGDPGSSGDTGDAGDPVAAVAAVDAGKPADPGTEALSSPWGAGRPAAFAVLQQRLGRKRLSTALLRAAPVVFLAYDLLEAQGQDVRAQSQARRRAQLESLLASGPVAVSPVLEAPAWPELARLREASRGLGVEGLMLKQRDAAYGVGRTRAQGLWWKWKTEPLVVDGVLVYAQAGHGRRASLYTDYTFAVWNRPPESPQAAQAVVEAIGRGEPLPAQPGVALARQPLQLVAFTKAYSGLTDAEFAQVDAVIRRSTLQKFGPVRSVRPSLVFELAFEGIQRSGRHKSGVALRFPRMARIRHDKPLHEADTLADLERLLPPTGAARGPAVDE